MAPQIANSSLSLLVLLPSYPEPKPTGVLLLLLRFFSLRLFPALLQRLLLLLTGKRLCLFLLFGLHAVAEVRQPGLDRLLRFHPAMETAQKLVQPCLHLWRRRTHLLFLGSRLGLLFLGRIAEEGTGPLLDVFGKGDGTIFDSWANSLAVAISLSRRLNS